MPTYSRATSVFLDLHKISPKRPDPKLLEEVSRGFAELPWENLTKFLRKHRSHGGAPATVPPALRGISGVQKLRFSNEVLADHAALGTGGTCFSLTNALRRIVTDLGFRAWPAMADMRHGPNVHCALVVQLEASKYLLDPGYLVAQPVPLDASGSVRVRQCGSSLDYCLAEGGSELVLHSHNDRGERQPRYRLRTGPVPEQEFVRHWVDSFDATGMNGLHLNRIRGPERLSAHDFNLRIDSGREKRNLNLRDAYADEVAQRFGIEGRLVERAYAEWKRRRCRRP